MSLAYPYRGLSKRLSVLCDIGKVWEALEEVPPASAEDPLPIAYRRLLEARLVRDFLAEKDGLARRARTTEEFRRTFESFDLSGTEGYLLSLVEGGLPLTKVLLVSYLGRFQTLLALIGLRRKGVVHFAVAAAEGDETMVRRRRP